MKTIKPTTKVIVTVVAAVLAAILIAGIVVGILYYFNSNTYLFRMSAFAGEYVNEAYLSFGNKPLYKYIYTFSLKSSSDDAEKESYGCYVQNGEYKFDKIGYNEQKTIDKNDFVPNVLEKLEFFAKLFDKKCEVTKNQIILGENRQVAQIISNEYIAKGEPSMPRRNILCRIGDGMQIDGVMYNIYRTDDSSRFIISDQRIEFTSSITIEETEQTYSLEVYCTLLNVDFIKAHRTEYTIEFAS